MIGIKEDKERRFRIAAAKTIGTQMQRVRQCDKELVSKRWIWELIQNANDCTENELNIKMRFSQNEFEFSHDGKCFNSESLLSLVTQLSTKGFEENEDFVGKFGTGFMTTHLLSEKVEILGKFLKADNIKIPLEFELDRSFISYKEIEQSLEKTLSYLDSLDEELMNYEDKGGISVINEFETKFKYNIGNDNKNIVILGIEEIFRNYGYLLAFNRNIKTISYNNITFFRKSEEELEEDILKIVISKKENGEIEDLEVLIVNSENVDIGIQIKEKEIKEIDKNIPRLFCKFPLIGSEEFKFPVVINSSKFEVYEQRNTIYEESPQNKNIMKEAADLYIKLLGYLGKNNYEKMHNLCERAFKIEFLSDEKLKEVRSALFFTKMIKTSTGNFEAFGIPNNKGGGNLNTAVINFI
ncbi:hypothetical protein, partial [uncultured Clostridium sp.]|uniref:sacsin N-terminal ATP-binding-like domain-containing protein n=1 Tax=uncultured Clostridium sp. TaxID=59620 RepID=UPI0026109946